MDQFEQLSSCLMAQDPSELAFKASQRLASSLPLHLDEPRKKGRAVVGDTYVTSEIVEPPSFKSWKTVEF